MVKLFFIGVIYYIGALMVIKYKEKQEDNYMCIYMLFMAAIGAGFNAANVPSIAKAKQAAKNIFKIIDEKSKIDVRQPEGIKEIQNGEIKFVNVDFTYPSRQIRVLRNFDLCIHATRKIAIVGYSGCGKSTLANLLLRFYDIQSGKILVDGRDIKDYNIEALRKQIGIVMQEPILFNQTIKDNILYGNDQASDK